MLATFTSRLLCRTLTVSALLLGATAVPARALVIDELASGPVSFQSAQASHYVGIVPVPGTEADLQTAGAPVVQVDGSSFNSTAAACGDLNASSPDCCDPWLPRDLDHVQLADGGLCWHQGGRVMHANETFALTWDPNRHYWAGTRNFVESFLRDVADASGSLSSRYALTSQYRDGPGSGDRAAYDSLYGGGCIDYGSVGGATCQFTNSGAQPPVDASKPAGSAISWPGVDYPTAACSSTVVLASGNTDCITDASIRDEVTRAVTEAGLNGHTASGFSPLIVVLLPRTVQICVTDTICSANSSAAGRFCSYHGVENVGGTDYSYLVQPWTPDTECDEAIPADPDVARYAGERLVSPLSAAHIATIVNPNLAGWYAVDGAEAGDNGCVPQGQELDSVKVNGTTYVLQPDFNNTGILEDEPNAPACALGVVLAPSFVPPSPISAGDQVWFDGSVTASTLMVDQNRYSWDFGDGGQPAQGASVVHQYADAGTYTVTLTVTDRGGNVRSLTKNVLVTSANGGGGRALGPALDAHVSIPPQTLARATRRGIALHVTSPAPADGIATVMIPRADARRAHLRVGAGPAVRVGLGTLTGIPARAGGVTLYLRLAPQTARKLARLGHVTVTVRLQLIGAGGRQVAVDVAARL